VEKQRVVASGECASAVLGPTAQQQQNSPSAEDGPSQIEPSPGFFTRIGNGQREKKMDQSRNASTHSLAPALR
jgi:hypothetical protein